MPRKSTKRARQPEPLDERPVKKAKVDVGSPSTLQQDPVQDSEVVQPSIALQLPPELLLEILSYFKSLSVPLELNSYNRHYEHMLSEQYLEQTDILRALSQTCKIWRRTFLPMLYRSLDVVSSHSESGAWYKTLGEAMIRKSKLVQERPDLAAHVRSVSVCLSRYSMLRVLPAMVSMIENLPNLETLQVVRTHHHMTTPLQSAFEGHIFPQIRAVHLPSYSHHILRCCPNVVKVGCNSYDDGSKLVTAIKQDCKKVEEVEGFWAHGNIMKRLTKAAPHLKTITIDARHLWHCSDLESLKGFKNLQNVIFMASIASDERYEEQEGSFGPMLQKAKDALMNAKSVEGMKSVKFDGGESEWVKTYQFPGTR